VKILDRYVTSSFIKNYLLSFMILVGLYIVLDMLFNFDDLITVRTREGIVDVTVWMLLQRVGDYYFYQVFLIFVQLSGIIPIVATSFTLMRMSRQNELSAILSAGVPLLRVALPIIIASVVLNGLLLVDQELIIPSMIPKLVRNHNEAGQTAGKSFPIQSMQDENHNLLLAARYFPDPVKPYMREVTIVQRNEDSLPSTQITAERADWEPRSNGGQWRLSGGKITTGLAPGSRPHAEAYDKPYKSNITPEEISLYRSNDYVNLLSTERINALLAPSRNLSYGVNQLLRVKHARFTQPLMNIILLLLAIPSVLTRTPGNLKSAAMKCLVISGTCMATVFLCNMLASQPPKSEWAFEWPAIMAWVPILIYGPVSVWLLDRVET
jgi:lipopolysaccharide export system permease protein